MRRLWSTLALLVVLAGLGAYIYMGKATPSSDATKQEKVFASLDPGTITELTVKPESGGTTTLKKDGADWKETAPAEVPAASSDVTAIANALADIDVTRVVDEAPADLKEYGLDPPRIEVSYKTVDGKSSGTLLLGAKTSTGSSLYARRQDEKRVILVPQYHETTLNKTAFDLRDKTIVKFDRAKVDRIDATIDGKTAEFVKTDGEWKMTKPLVARADSSAVEGLIGHVEGLQMKGTMPTALTSPDLKPLGLDKPSTINLHLGSETVSVQLGSKAGEVAYVRDAAKPDIYSVEATALDDLKKPAEDYRKKEVFDFRAFNATRVEITRAGKTLTLERVKATEEGKADTWRRVTPTASDPDSSAVQNFLAGLADIRATSFVDSKAKTGLDNPAMTVVAKFDEGKKEERVTFGKSGDDVFASRPDDPGAAKIDASKFDDAVKAFDELSK